MKEEAGSSGPEHKARKDSVFSFQGASDKGREAPNQIAIQRSDCDLKRRKETADMELSARAGSGMEQASSDDDAPLAQLVEQLTLNQWVPGSSP